MPFYEYECKACGKRTDHQARMGEAPASVPCECGCVAGRVFSVFRTSLRNAGDPERAAAFQAQEGRACVRARTPNEQLSVDPADGRVRKGKRPRSSRRKVVSGYRSSSRGA